MKASRLLALGMAWCAAIGMIALPASPAAAEEDAVVLKVGDKAPDFSLVGSDGKTYTLEQFKGKKSVLLAFFPKAFTPG